MTNANLVDADLTDANLSRTDLTGALFAGVRWSMGTRWPGAVAERLREESREIGPGLWEVIGPGGDRDHKELPVR